MKKMFLFLSMLALLVLLIACNSNEKDSNDDAMVKGSTTTKNDQPMQREFADPKYTETGKQMMNSFQSENFDAYGEYLSENVVYNFFGGDSMVGKKAVVDYWKARFANVVDELQFGNDIWLPIQVNQPQRGPDLPGVWLITWHQVNARYKSGKSLQFWIHTDYHFDKNNQIDRVIQYMDRAPINAAINSK